LLWRQKAANVSQFAVFDIPCNHNIDAYVLRLKKEWKREERQSQPSFIKAILRTFRRNVLWLTPTMAIEMFAHIGNSLLVAEMLYWLRDEETEQWKGFIYAMGLTLVALALALAQNHTIRNFKLLGGAIRATILEVLTDKILNTSVPSLNKAKAGTLINLASQHLDILENVQFAVMIVYIPIFVIFATGVLCWRLGWVGLVTSAVTISILPIQIFITKVVIKEVRNMMRIIDQRVGLVSAVLDGIKLIKMFAWTQAMYELVSISRLAEAKSIIRKFTVLGCTFNISSCGHAVILLVTFVVYVQKWEMSVPDILGTWSLILSLHFYVNGTMSGVIGVVTNMRVIGQRLGELMQSKDWEEVRFLTSKASLEVRRLSASWKPDVAHISPFVISRGSDTDALKITPSPRSTRRRSSGEMMTYSIFECAFKAKPGELCFVIGPTGSGKSSLLMALLGELNIVEGDIALSGKVAYVEQEPWLFVGSVRDNIILNKEFDEDLYGEVTQVCCLETDLEALSDKDQTIIGPKGTNLSGGQKARIALARALYSKSEIYLLDDPLSAVDSVVAKDLFKHAICDYLQGKTIVLVTHQTQYAIKADKVVVMSQGTIVFFGTYPDAVEDTFCSTLLSAPQNNVLEKSPQRRGSVSYHIEPVTDQIDEKRQAKVVEPEEVDSVPISLYIKFLRAAYGTVWILLPWFLANCLFQVSYLAIPYWLTLWAAQSWEEQQRAFYPCILFLIFALAFLFGLIRVRLVASTIIRASSSLHNRVVGSLLHTHCRFFDLTPVGQILAVLTRDVMSLDSELIETTLQAVEYCFMIAGLFILIVVLNQYSLAPLAIAVILIGILIFKTSSVARELRKSDMIAKGPILSHISSILAGIPSIRAYQVAPMIRKAASTSIRNSFRAYCHFYWQILCCSLYMDLIAVLLIGANSFIVAALKGTLDAQTIGIGLSYTMMILLFIANSARRTMMATYMMTSAQRLDQYTHLDPESSPPFQPFQVTNGRIAFQGVYMKYAPELDYVLQDLSFIIEAGMKVGVVGRTAAGKSSLIAVVFGLVPLQQGSVCIDDQAIAQVDVTELRKELAVIPQQPFLFAGSIRENLDLFKHRSEEDLWEALRGVELETYVAELPQGLDTEMSQATSLSLGQRQLICLARAALRRNKILFMDEATANIDKGTDDLIQRKLRDKFAHCTVVTIAHRIRTVIDNDRVIVMDAGRCVEYDTPKALLERPRSIFTEIVNATGLEESASLRRAAGYHR